MEGVFLSLMETNTKFRTSNPDEAHVYFLPFSVVMIIEHLFHPVIRDKAVLKRTVSDYVRIISHKGLMLLGMFVNSTTIPSGSYATQTPQKDASFQSEERCIISGDQSENRGDHGLTGGSPPSNRTVLAFFAGKMHGKLRPALFQHWMGKDEDVQVYETLPQGISYHEMMKKSRYCICPSGHEVASPRIAEAIYAECVPVLISQHYIFPFSDVLDWDSFTVQVPVTEIPDLKNILEAIPEDQYSRMQERVKQVQRHFLVNNPPERYDVFHMIIHSIWLRRLNVRFQFCKIKMLNKSSK
ncbi:EXOSTOSIN FAMILY PROTEIN [Salix purpurea]|uniref:EXOSTOSIN FAMILY PROTEIN n=1 Tax=Salix purpurea TaxID=77065 RepID=A0A9Q0SKQ3_SALPP|nr:EXOSTOSIN FAMILY PROTEIN [Salix purpurea]